jgi:hypothetical protein
VHDYATWRGLLVFSGLEAGAAPGGHVVRSDDGAAAVWLGAVDDLWAFGRPVGVGGPWKDTAVTVGTPSDPYLMTGYERKTLTLAHAAPRPVRVKVELEVTGTGRWFEYAAFDVAAGTPFTHVFPDGFEACWLRVSADTATTATAWLVYE